MAVSVGDYVWRDVNNDGLQNEAAIYGMNDIPVTLFTDAGVQIGDTTVTANDVFGNPGYYSFDDVPAGDYYVIFTAPFGQVFTTPLVGLSSEDSNADSAGKSDTFSLSTSASDLTLDAGIRPIDLSLTNSVSNTTPRVGDDITFTVTVSNASGLSTATEVKVRDSLPSGYTIRTVTGDGTYSRSLATWTIETLAAGETATLHILANVGTSGIKNNLAQVNSVDQPDFDSTPGNALDAHEDDDAAVMIIPTARIGNYVWWDQNADGIQADVEPPIGGASVKLLQNGIQVNTALTDVNGRYVFEDLTPGDYAVQFDYPADFDRASPPNAGTLTGADSDGLGTQLISATVNLLPGQSILSIDQGFYKLATIGDYVWRDVNNDGVQNEAANFGVNDVSVSLFTNDGVPVGSPITTADDVNGNPGYYLFADLTPGRYFVRFTAPTGQVFTDSTGGDPATDSDANSEGQTTEIVLLSGFDVLSIDAGLRPIDLSLSKSVTNTTPQIGTTVTYVVTLTNANGLSSATGVIVEDVLPAGLSYISDNSSGAFNNSTRTWTVGTLAPGATALLQVVASVSTPGAKTNVAQVLAADQPDLDSIPGNAPGVHEDDDASVVLTPSASIGNYVWRDVNNNGIQDEAASLGINGVTVTLFTSAGLQVGPPVVTTDNSSGNPGYYLIGDIDPGNYYVVFTAPAGQVFTTQLAGGSALDSNADSSGRSNAFSLLSGVDELSIDAGFSPIDLSLTKSVSDTSPRIGSLVNYVVSVSNANGFSRATGVTVKDVLPAGLTYVSDNSSGGYDSGTGLWTVGTIAPASSATLQIVATVVSGGLKSNQSQVQSADQPDFDSIPGNAASVNEDDDATVSLTPSANIGNYVWRDENNNGIQDESAIAGLNGIRVTLFTSAAAQVGTPVITANDGSGNPGYYLFMDVDPGSYYLVFTAPSGQTFTTPFVGANGTDSNADNAGKSNTFSLTSGVDDLTIDAGFRNPAGNQVCAMLDLNGNTATSGSPGNIRTITSGVISAKASGFSRDRATGVWSNAYLGSYGGGVGVTDNAEGNGGNETHAVDNLEGRDNYVLFEFNQSVVIDSAYLGYAVNDSDLTVWIGTVPNAFNNHQTLSDALLAGLYVEENLTELTAARLADINASGVLGNFIIIAANVKDTTPEDRFKIGQLTVCTPGSQQPASLGDAVWHDQNGNGIREPSEPGIAGASVTLTGGGADGVINGLGDTVTSTVTNSGGAYSFGGLVPGTQYRVTFALPTGYLASSPRKAGSDAGLDSDGLVSDTIILVSGQSIPTIDAGFFKEVKVGNYVWNDLDADGIQDSTEVGIGGVAMSLSGTSGNGTSINVTTTTAADGSYHFKALPPGTYQVSVAATNFATGALQNYTASPTLVGTNRGVDSNTSPSATLPATLTSGENDFNVDFGYYLTTANVCVNLFLEGNTPSSGTAGNILTFSSSSISAKASAFSRDSAGKWSTAYLGRYGGGLGVTDASEGNGSGTAHTVDNVGRNNYVLFEFSQSVTIDTAFIGYVTGDSDVKVWIGNANDAFNTHNTLSDAFLAGLGFTEVNLGGSSTRTADLNSGNVAGNILVMAANVSETNDQFKIAELGLCAKVPKTSSGTKFFSVDDDSNRTYKYGSVGNFLQDFVVAPTNVRGITANVTGTNVWVADYYGRIYNYSSAGAHVANWNSNISGLQGVTTNGTHIWTVSETTDKVYYYANGATFANGSSKYPSSSFSLNHYNSNPTDLTTDGTFIWVVNEGNIAGGVGDMVFKYSLSGSYLGRWQLDSANARPTGITVDPAGGNKLWIVDNEDDRIYEYSGATGCISGGLIAAKSYALAPGNTNPQGIADPTGPDSEVEAMESSLVVNEQYLNPAVNPFYNTFNATDVSGDGVTSPLDVLLVINRLNAHRAGQEQGSPGGWIFDDVSNDGDLSPLDALLVINFLSTGRSSSPAPILEVDTLVGNATQDSQGTDEELMKLGEGESQVAADAYFAEFDANSHFATHTMDRKTGPLPASEESELNRRRALRLR